MENQGNEWGYPMTHFARMQRKQVGEIFHGLTPPAIPPLSSSITSVQSFGVKSSRSGFPSKDGCLG